jgi:hypothetical protein
MGYWGWSTPSIVEFGFGVGGATVDEVAQDAKLVQNSPCLLVESFGSW